MKMISVHVSVEAYEEFKRYGRQRGRAVAELVREAMDNYVDQKIRPSKKLVGLPTTSQPRLKKRWTREEIQEEMIGDLRRR